MTLFFILHLKCNIVRTLNKIIVNQTFDFFFFVIYNGKNTDIFCVKYTKMYAVNDHNPV